MGVLGAQGGLIGSAKDGRITVEEVDVALFTGRKDNRENCFRRKLAKKHSAVRGPGDYTDGIRER